MSNINWSNISKAIAWYQEARGYKYVELPWIIPEKFNKATHPFHDGIFHTLGGTLLGSAEQAFVFETYEGRFSHGKYISCSPCFRNEPILDATHQTHFMKCELFISLPNLDDKAGVDSTLDAMIFDAQGFFDKFTPDTFIIPTEIGYDIELNGVEIGSYGIRSYEHVHWIYGTGLAEPRFSTALNM